MEGAAQTTPVVEDPRGAGRKRRSHKRGGAPVRLSKRAKGEEPSILDEFPKNAAVKKLSLGGRGGRPDFDEAKWNFYGNDVRS